MRHRILLIDDDPIAHLISRRILSRSFPEEIIKEFLSASPAIAYLEEQRNQEDYRFIVFLDINMPGISGWDFLKILKEKFSFPDLRVYLLTSSVSQSDKEKAQTFEAVKEFIEKPFSIAKLEKLELQRQIFPAADFQ